MAGLLCILLLTLSSVSLFAQKETAKERKEVEQIEGVKVQVDTLRKNVMVEQMKYTFKPDTVFIDEAMRQQQKLDSILIEKKKKKKKK